MSETVYEDKELIERLRLALQAGYMQLTQLHNMLNAGFITMDEYRQITKLH